MSDIREIPGIGEKTARRLIEHFGSEDAVLDAFKRHDVTAIADAPGVGQKNAVTLVQGFIFRDEKFSPDDFLKTKEVWRVYRKLLEIIRSYASTSYAKDKLNIYFPLSSSKKENIMSVMTSVSKACLMVNGIAANENGIIDLKNALKSVRPIKGTTLKKVRDRVLVAADHDEYKMALAGFGHAIDVILAGSPRELADTAAAYHHVTASMELEGVDLPYNVNITYADLGALEAWKVVPEQEIALFSGNLASIKSAAQAYDLVIDTESRFFSSIKRSDVSFLETILDRLADDGGVRSGSDPDVDRIQSVLEHLDGTIKAAENAADTHFKEYLNSSTVTLTGKDLLDAVSGGVRDLLDRGMAERYRQIIKESIFAIIKDLDLDPKEGLYLDSLFPDDIVTTIQADMDVVEQFRQYLHAELANSNVKILKETARSLSGLKDTARQLVSEAMELDMWFAIGLFAIDRGLVTPQMVDEAGIDIKGGANLFLAGNVEPVNYSLGNMKTDYDADGYSPERVVVLSGVNSGGKTSTLDLITQVMILAHMGFPVPAEAAVIGLVDEIYYFGKSGGTMDAGAFESTIREFSVVSGTGKMAVFVDELESITEPGASARIIGGILEYLADNPLAIGVFVSHLAENIMEHTSAHVRVDGIEARGLDKNLNLIVDRNPRYNYVAKSTPELIVERLVRQSDGVKRDFYQHLLDKFK
jgi:DNA mismatch repair protein MutS2